MMDAVVFSWSGSFRKDMEERQEEIEQVIAFGHEWGFDVGLLAVEDDADVEEALPEDVAFDFVMGNVDNILKVMGSLASKYEKVFFVSDVQAELASVNQSGAFTVGFTEGDVSADELGGVGPNYMVDSLEELEKILVMEFGDAVP